jgi:hypothetical protein
MLPGRTLCPRTLWRCMLRIASWIVPGRARREWWARRESRLSDWWLLVERGELTTRAHQEMALDCWRSFADAFWLRFHRDEFKRFLRGPAAVLSGAAAVVLITAALTRGLAFTMALARRAVEPTFSPAGGIPAAAWGRDMLFAHAFPLAFAFAVGLALVATAPRPFLRRGWRIWAFLAAKTACVMVVVPLVWIETGAAIRALMPRDSPQAALVGLLSTLILIFAFGNALLWSFADQHKRCPVCLERLVFPVSVGSWASVFEPATTELVCEKGHGSLSVPETDVTGPGRWTVFDSSWQDLFAGGAR